MRKVVNLVGKTYGRLTVISAAGRINKYFQWNCLCLCGQATIVRTASLNNGTTQSCGCLGKEKLLLRTRHGYGGRLLNRRPEYRSWNKMIDRCTNPKHNKWGYYGGRGITVCDDWLTFTGFLKDMGDAPEGKPTIERLDPNKGYCKSNCIWESWERQHYNTTRTVWVEYNGERKCLMEWSKELNIGYSTLRYRINTKKMSPEKAFTV